jgi:hypothetical protein
MQYPKISNKISTAKMQTANFLLQTLREKLNTSSGKLPTATCLLRTLYSKLPTENCQLNHLFYKIEKRRCKNTSFSFLKNGLPVSIITK